MPATLTHAFDLTLGGTAPYTLVDIIDGDGAVTRCDHCGTRIRWVFVITDSNEERRWAVGSDCITKVDSRFGEVANRAKADFLRRREIAERLAAEEAEYKLLMDGYQSEDPEFFEAISKGQHRILREMAEKLRKWRQPLSEKQVLFAKKLWAEEKAPAPKGTAPTGRVVVEGEVVSLKWHEAQVGWQVVHTEKATIRGADANGHEFRVWVSVPRAASWSVGDRVKVKATFEPGDSPDFAFGKRPTLA